MHLRHLLGTATLALLTQAAYAQQPALPGAPQPGQPATAPAPIAPTRTTALPNAEVIGHPEIVGQTYSVETLGGTIFSGKLLAATDLTLTFETKELGVVTVQRTSLREITAQTAEQARRGFDYVGNGTHMFFAPTARNLHQGEGEVQALEIFILGVDYGLTDNISVGLLAPVVPGFGVPFLAVTPKVSVPVADKFRVGGSLLYGFATGSSGSSGSAGVAYGVATYGTADTNVSFGLGYGFSSDRYSSDGSAVGVLGANIRISRLVSLVNETYITGAGRGGVLGIAGVRLGLSRLNFSAGALYITGFGDGGIYPAYLSGAYRFGKVKLK